MNFVLLEDHNFRVVEGSGHPSGTTSLNSLDVTLSNTPHGSSMGTFLSFDQQSQGNLKAPLGPSWLVFTHPLCECDHYQIPLSSPVIPRPVAGRVSVLKSQTLTKQVEENHVSEECLHFSVETNHQHGKQLISLYLHKTDFF